MANNMSMEWHDEKSAWRFFNGDDPAREIWLTNEEANFIAMALKHDNWHYDIMNQCEYDEGNLDFSETTQEEFIGLCFEEIDSNIEIYGDDWEPDIEEIVFDVANENGIWRD